MGKVIKYYNNSFKKSFSMNNYFIINKNMFIFRIKILNKIKIIVK